MAEISNYISTSVNRKTGMSPIYVTFYLQNEKVTIPTKVSTKREWFVDGSVCRKDKEYKDKNLIIEQIRAHVSNIFTKYRLREKSLTKTLFLQQWTRLTGYDTFFDFADWFMLNHRPLLRNLFSETYGILALLLIYFYSGKTGRRMPKAFYYFFYPLHLLIIGIIRITFF